MSDVIEKTVNDIVKESFDAGRKHGVEEEKERMKKEFVELADKKMEEVKTALDKGWRDSANWGRQEIEARFIRREILMEEDWFRSWARFPDKTDSVSESIQAPQEKPVIDTPKIDTKEQHSCPKCGKKYQYINSFRKHLKGHDYNEAEISQIELGGKQNAIPENK